MSPGRLFFIIWVGWVVSWIAAAVWSGRTEKRMMMREELIYRVLILVGVVLISHWSARALGERRLWHVGYDGAYALAGLTFAGVLFTWWGRLHLGRLWSGTITRKEGHRVVDSGPYALVRHPIYTGLIAAALATVVAKATAAAIAGWMLVTLGLWLKARAEERFLAAELDPGAYAAYRRRVPMLVPFLSSGD